MAKQLLNIDKRSLALSDLQPQDLGLAVIGPGFGDEKGPPLHRQRN
jgi:hypothetical protein